MCKNHCLNNEDLDPEIVENYCDACDAAIDWDAHAQRNRERIAEQNEY